MNLLGEIIIGPKKSTYHGLGVSWPNMLRPYCCTIKYYLLGTPEWFINQNSSLAEGCK